MLKESRFLGSARTADPRNDRAERFFSTLLNEDIGSLVKKGLPVKVQKSLDVVRVIGNNAVHPGQISVEDDPGIAASLFTLVNIICEHMISQPKHIEEMYSKLPDQQRAAIQKRDTQQD